MNKGTAVLRQQNEKKALRLLRTAGSLSRQEMAERLGLSKNTVSVIVQKWIGSGIIREGAPEDAGGVGRPRIPLQLIPGRFQAVGLVVGMSSIRYTVTDYGSLVLEEDRRSVQGLSPEDCIEELAALCRELLERYPNVIGIGVAVPALLDPLTGRVLSSSHLEWKDVPLKERMDRQLPVPVLVLNNVKASAMAPVQATHLESGKSSFYMRIGEGVGGAILLNGGLYYGESWTAGEVGHLCVDREGPRCSCGRKGCLEALVRIPRVLEQLGQEGREWSDALGDGTMVAEERFNRTLAQAGGHVGFALSQVVNLLNPHSVTIDSPYGRYPAFCDAVRKGFEDQALTVPASRTGFTFTHLPNASGTGAAYAVILEYEKE